MSTPSPNPPTPRNNKRNQKKITTPSARKVDVLTTPPSSPPRNSSPGEAATDSSINGNLAKKKNPRSTRKPRDTPKPSPAHNNGHRHTSSHPTNTTPQVKDSSHYAGPTFHASPAPSALPIPSFFSKSVLESEPVQGIDGDYLESEPDLDGTPSKPRPRFQPQLERQQSTPLDFLFKAAVEARNSQSQRSPEVNDRVLSPQTEPRAQYHRKANGFSGEVSPLGIESPGGRNSQIGPSFATSYKDRMNALRSASSPSAPTLELDEEQRRAKTEALKDLLLNPRPQKPPTASSRNHAIGHNMRLNLGHNVPHYATPLRTTSGPAATISRNRPYQQNQSLSGNGLQSPFSHPHSGPQHFQNPPHWKEALSTNPANVARIPGGTSPSPFKTYDSARPPHSHAQQPAHYPPALDQSPASRNSPANTSSPAVDTKKMEDDLRRILKLDADSGFPSSGIQSSFA